MLCVRTVVLLSLFVLTLVTCRTRVRNNLSLWIDEEQVHNLIGVSMEIWIISEGHVFPYLREPGLSDQIIIPPEIDTVNLTWQAGDQVFNYWFENLTSLNPHLLYNPLLSIPARGVIPNGPTVFQMSIPCTGRDKGIAFLVLGLRIYNRRRQQIDGTPIAFKLRKKCVAFAVCNPICQNNGTCIAPEVCACPKGYKGNRCEIAICEKPCQNGGRCLDEGLCWCEEGFYGDYCEFSHCKPHCVNGGTCQSPNRCQCPPDFTGARCEHSTIKTDTDRPRRSKGLNSEREQRRDKKKKRRKTKRKTRKRKDFEKKMRKTERRVIKIIRRNSRNWTLSKEDRRTFRKLDRESKNRSLDMKERKFLLNILNSERNKLNDKEKQKLRRLKKLMRLERRRLAKTKKKKRKVFV